MTYYILNVLKSTTKRVGRRLVALMNGCDRDELSAVNLRYIEKLYGEYGPEVLDLVRANLKRALQIIFHVLWQKKGKYIIGYMIDQGTWLFDSGSRQDFGLGQS
ncbi:hypothetical protein LguiA_013451 [Lonicera macranthoides]